MNTDNFLARMSDDSPRGFGVRPTQRPASNSEARKRAALTPAIPAHLTIDEARGKADCSVCGTGVTAPASFGGVPRSNMLAAFIVQHSVHTKAGNASGLTAAGNATKAARAALGGAS